MHVRLPVVNFRFEECDLLNGQLQPDTLTPSFLETETKKPNAPPQLSPTFLLFTKYKANVLYLLFQCPNV